MTRRTFYFILGALGIILLSALILHFEGRLWICACGYVKLWHGVVVSSENSQHLFDWYTFTHLIHGLAIYLLLWIIDRKKRLSIGAKLLIAIGIEGAWEILENSPMVINRYRATTISLDYYGDSVINSIGDILAMTAGFYFAYRAKIWWSVIAYFVIEIALALIIRDNLTLNMIMLIHPIDAIKLWQGGL